MTIRRDLLLKRVIDAINNNANTKTFLLIMSSCPKIQGHLISESESIQETKKPKRNLVAEACFNAIRSDKTVGNVLDLRESLAGTTDLKKIVSIHLEIAFGRIGDIMFHRTQLI